MIDLTGAELHLNRYGGSEKKIAVKYKDKRYMLKFPDPVREKSSDLKYMYNTFSEDIGCKIFKTMGFEVQKTFLAKFNFKGEEKIVVACEDFCQDGAKVIEVDKLLLSNLDIPRVSRRGLSLSDAVDTIYKIFPNEISAYIDKIIFEDTFWDMFVADTLIGNPDRNTHSWGFLKQNGKMKFAPIYGCSSALDALSSDEDLKAIQMSGKFEEKECSITSAFLDFDRQRIYYSKFYRETSKLNNALSRIVPKIDFDKIKKIIEDTEGISDFRKKYLFDALNCRFDKIIFPAFQKAKSEQQQRPYKDGLLTSYDTPETIKFFGDYVLGVLNGTAK